MATIVPEICNPVPHGPYPKQIYSTIAIGMILASASPLPKKDPLGNILNNIKYIYMIHPYFSPKSLPPQIAENTCGFNNER